MVRTRTDRPSDTGHVPVDHSGKVGWEGQLSQLADLLETDPEAGMRSLGGFLRPMEQEQLDREMPDEHGPMNLNESTIIATVAARHPELLPCRKCGALGWLYPCSECGYDLSDEERQRIADEIEMDML